MGPFNSREIATAIWFILFISWALRYSDIRKALYALGRAFFNWKVIVPACLMALYMATIVIALFYLNFWYTALLKDTLIWFCITGMAMMVRFITANDGENLFRKVVGDTIKIVIVLEFLVNTYTFPIYIELFLIPFLALIAMFGAYSDASKKDATVSSFIKGVQIIVGFSILAGAVFVAISDMQHLQSLNTLRSIALAPVLSLLLIPFLYALLLVSEYEQVFLRLHLGREKKDTIKRYARRKIIAYAGLRLSRLRHLKNNCSIELLHISNKADVEEMISKALTSFCSKDKVKTADDT